MSGARRTAVWLLSCTLAFPGDVIVAAVGTPPRSPDSVRRAANRVLPLAGNSTAYAAPAATAMPGDAADGGTCQNEIACENTLPGVAPAVWDLPGAGAGDLSIQGFATEISVTRNETIRFKVDTNAAAYRIDIYRLGYYGGNGARLVDKITNPIPRVQPDCLNDASTGLYDCGNWSQSASWVVPATAVSGIYLAKLVRTDTGGASHIVFVVRNDDSRSDLLFQTSDTTWQAYNAYAGNSLYNGAPAGRAFKVSYNRPLVSRGDQGGGQASSLFNAEYPMVRWLEANGYDVSYTSGVDTDRRGQELLEHKVFLSVGHDEYWSGAQRSNVEAARGAGVHLAFFSGNEIFWKTRWEKSIDTSQSQYRTLVCYKETHANAKIDPNPLWTGTWRDPRPFNPEGAKAENALTGTIFMVNGTRNDSIMVPAVYGTHRFWRHTSIAQLLPGQTAILPPGTLGYEWDEDLDNGFRPAGLQRLSSTTIDVWPLYLQDYGSNYGLGTATHSLTLYRAASGALVFGAGTVQWSWGLDSHHDRGGEEPSREMQQATVNLLADMSVQPTNLQPDLVTGSQVFDLSPPTSTIVSPPAGPPTAIVASGDPVIISGTASDNNSLSSIEVSVDGGATWGVATGLNNWTFNWMPTGSGTVTIKSRAFDDSGNVQLTPASVTVTVSRECPCSIWGPSVVPPVPSHNDPVAIELGMKFKATTNGLITGLRFYKGSGNTGTHTGNLWTVAGTRLATATFTGETALGWQQVDFAAPVAITAGTTYVASYHAPNGGYPIDRPSDTTGPGFTTAIVNAPLRALADGEDGANGVFKQSVTSTFPTDTYDKTNYYVDVVFLPDSAVDTTPPFVTAKTPPQAATGVTPFTNVTARFSEAIDPATITQQTFKLQGPGGLIGATVAYVPATRSAIVDPTLRLDDNTTYTATVSGGPTGVRDLAGHPLAADVSWSFTTASPVICPCTIWTPETVPTFLINNADDSFAVEQGIELGMKFRADTDGYISGIRFYKSSNNVGEHTGTLWTATGTPLAHGTFSGETDLGWQQLLFASPVFVQANQTYVASYHTDVGRYSVNRTYFLGQFSSFFTRPPLRAIVDGDDGPNGVFKYGDHSFPTETFLQSNYWVDVVFTPGAPSDEVPPVVTSRSPLPNATGVQLTANISATLSEAIDPATLTQATFEIKETLSGAPVTAVVLLDPSWRIATLDPNLPLANSTSYTVTLRGGPGGVHDATGNPMAADVTWSFTTEAPVVCPCTIWPASAVPTILPNNTDDQQAVAQGIELGVKFQADRTGTITGIRFYKAAANLGAHTGTLWTAAGVELATVTFVGESVSGWQQMQFASPVPIVAGQTYVASYHAPVGRYSVDGGYFAPQFSALYTRPPLKAMPSDTPSTNGVYSYGPRVFPGNSFNHSNYWVDVVFEPAPNTAPSATADSYSVNEDATLTVTSPGVLANDTDTDPLTAALVGGPANGALSLSPNGSFVYTPNANFHGTDSFVYKANDGALDSLPTTVTITVISVNDLPAAVADSYSVNEDATLTVTAPGVLANDTDVDATPLSAVLLGLPANGVLTLTADGSFV